MRKNSVGIKKLLSLPVIALICVLSAATIAFASVVLFRSLVTGKGNVSANEISGEINFSVNELTSGKAFSSAAESFTLSKAGDKVSFSIKTDNSANAHLTHAHSLSLKSVKRNGATVSGELENAIKSAVLVYYDGVFAGTLSSLTQNGEFSFGKTFFIPKGKSDVRVVTFELHSAADAYFGSTIELTVSDRAENADAGKYLFVTDEASFKKAIDDVNSGLLSTLGTSEIPTLVITAPLVLTSDYTITAPLKVDLLGNALDFGGGKLRAESDLTIFSSVRFATAPTVSGNITLASDDASLDVRDFYAADGALASDAYSAIAVVEKFNEAKANELIAARVKENVGYGIAAGKSADALGSLKFYLSRFTLSATDCTVSNGVITAPAALGASKVSILTAGTVSHEFKIYGNDDDAVLAAIKAGPLAHLDSLSPVAESVTSDLFLPSAIGRYGATIEWVSSNPTAMSSSGKMQDAVSDGAPVTLYATVRINERVYTLAYSFTVSSINNELRFNNFIAALSPLKLKDVWTGGGETTDDFKKSHQFLPNAVEGSAYNYKNAFVSPNPDEVNTSAKLEWAGYDDIGLASLTYSQDATYNYVSVYDGADGSQAVFLNTPVFSTFAQITVSATFDGDDEVYEQTINIIIETGNYGELLDEVFGFVQSQLDEIDVYKNVVQSRMKYGMANEKGDFSISSVYSISSSSMSAGKYSISYDVSAANGVLTASDTPLLVEHNGSTRQAYALIDDPDGYAESEPGAGYYIKVSTGKGYYYVKAIASDNITAPDGENVIDGTGKYFLAASAGATMSVNLAKADSVESRVPITVTVRYTYKPLVTTTRTVYVTIPAVIKPDEYGFSNYSVFSSVKYQTFRRLPAAERINEQDAFGTVATSGAIVNRTGAYILALDVSRCNGNAGNWFDGAHNGENLTIGYGDKLDSLRFYVGKANASVNADEAKVYDLLRLIQWATGNAKVSAASVISGSYPALATSLSVVSDGNEYLTPDELNLLKAFYKSLTGLDDAATDDVFAAITTKAPGRVITDGTAFDAAIKNFNNGNLNATTYFKFTELMRWALNKQNFPKSAFWDSSYPLGNPPNGGSLRYNTYYTTADGKRYYFIKTGTNSLQSGYFNEDDTEYISDKEEVVLQAFWNTFGYLNGYKTAFANNSVVPAYLNENAVRTLVSALYAKLGYPKDYAAETITADGKIYPLVTSLDGSLAALPKFTELKELYIAGNTSLSGSTETAGLPAFLTSAALKTAYGRIHSSTFAPNITSLTLHAVAQDHVKFDLTGIASFTSLTRLDLGMNYGIKSVGTLLNLGYGNLTYLDVAGADSADEFKDYPLGVIYQSSGATMIYSADGGVVQSGKLVTRSPYDGTGENYAEELAYIKELEQIDSQYVQLQGKVFSSGGTAGTKDIYWQVDEGNQIYKSPVRNTGVYTNYAGTVTSVENMTALQNNYYYFNATVTVNGVTLQKGYVYPIALSASGEPYFDATRGYAVSRHEGTSVPYPTDGEIADAVNNHGAITDYGLTITKRSEDSSESNQTSLFTGGTSSNGTYYLSSDGSSNNVNGGTRYNSAYRVTVETVTIYDFTYRGISADTIIDKLGYLVSSDSVTKFSYTVYNDATVSGTVTVTSYGYRYYGTTDAATNELNLSGVTTLYLLRARNNNNFTVEGSVTVSDDVSSSAVYACGTYSATVNGVTATETSVRANFPESAVRALLPAATTHTNLTATTLRTQSVPEINSQSDADNATARLAAVLAGDQTVAVYLYSGASGDGSPVTDYNTASYSFAQNAYYRLTFGATNGYGWEHTGVTTSSGSGVTMESLLGEANAAANTVKRGNHLGMYVYYGGSVTATVNGRKYVPGCVYRIVWTDETHTKFTYDDADGYTRVCREVDASTFQTLPQQAKTPGGIYYLTKSGNYYAANKFYVMTFDSDGFWYLTTFGDAITLLNKNENETANAYFRIKNNRMYVTSGQDYSGTGGTVTVKITAVVKRDDGTECERKFLVTVIG